MRKVKGREENGGMRMGGSEWRNEIGRKTEKEKE